MAEGFKIADGYVEVETKFDGDRMVKNVQDTVSRAEPRISRSAGENIGESLVRGIGTRMRDSRGRFVSSVSDPIVKSKNPLVDTGRKHIGRALLDGIGDAMSKGKELAGRIGSGIASSAKNPVLIAAIGVLGTILSGGVAASLTAALGIGAAVGFLGVGAFALRENKKIRREFEKTGKSVSKTLADAAKPLAGPFISAIREVRTTFGELAPDLKGIFSDLVPSVGQLTDGLSGLLKGALSGIRDAMPGITAALKGFASGLPAIGQAVGDFFRSVFGHPELVQRMAAGITSFASGAIRFLGSAISGLTVVWGAFTNVVALWRMGWGQVMAMVDGGSGMFSRLGASLGPLKTAIGAAWKALVSFASETDKSELPEKFRTLVSKVKATWGPLKTFLGTVWSEAWALIRRTWSGKVVPWIEGSALPWLRAKVQQAMSAIFKAMVDRAVGFLQGLPGKARAAISSLPGIVGSVLSSAASTARSRASSLVSGFIDRVKALPSRARSALGSARSAIIGVFSGAGSWLVSAGSRIISGLISGIQSAVGRLRSVLSGITGMIPDWKGPEDVDARLLEPAGRSIIQGFQKGISSQVPSLKSQLQGLTAAVPSMAGPGPGGPSVNFGGLTVNVHVPAGSDGKKIGREAALEIYRALKDLERSYS